MGDKKKPAPPPAKAPTPPAKSASPPTAPGPAAPEPAKEEAPPPAPTVETNAAEVPVNGQSDAPVVGPTVAPGIPKLELPPTYKLTPPIFGDQSKLQTPQLDWLSVRRQLETRGLQLDARMAADIQGLATSSRDQLVKGWGLDPATAETIVKFATPIAVGNALKGDHPTALEQFDQDTGKMLGRPVSTYTIPVISPDTLGPAIKLLTGKSVDLRF